MRFAGEITRLVKELGEAFPPYRGPDIHDVVPEEMATHIHNAVAAADIETEDPERP